MVVFLLMSIYMKAMNEMQRALVMVTHYNNPEIIVQSRSMKFIAISEARDRFLSSLVVIRNTLNKCSIAILIQSQFSGDSDK